MSKIRRWLYPKFKYPIDPQWPLKSNFINRLAARITVRMIYHSLGESYQFGGYTGLLMEQYEMVDADKFQVMHWVLREAGYSCSPADVMESCGVDPDTRKATIGPKSMGDHIAIGKWVRRHIQGG